MNRLFRLMRRPLPVAPAAIWLADIEWQAYLRAHRDLDGASTEIEALHHFHHHGRAEGWLATAAAMAAHVAAAEAAAGQSLPAAFDWRTYLAQNPDCPVRPSSYEAAAHYLASGRHEGRLFRRLDLALYRSLHLPADWSDEAVRHHFGETGQITGLDATLEDVAARLGLPGGLWLARLDPGRFAAVNADWAGPLRHRGDVLHAMAAGGLSRMAPLAPDLFFEPAYYRDANPGVANLPDRALYRHWLLAGLPDDRPGSAAEHLRRHGLHGATFPDGFDWRRYHGMPNVHGDSRWALLDHLVADNDRLADAVPVHGPEADAFLRALGNALLSRLSPRGQALLARAETIATTESRVGGPS